jgi:hypothetical protein
MDAARNAIIGCLAAMAVLPILAAIISGRRRHRSDWVAFGIRLAIPVAILAGTAAYLAQWHKWRGVDRNLEATIQRASAVLVKRTALTDFYQSGNYEVPRPRFRPDLGAVFAAGLMLGISVAGLGLLVRAFVPRAKDRTGHCRHCGYNLTGAPHERCPECGEAVPLFKLNSPIGVRIS